MASRSAMSLAECNDIFRSSDESYYSFSRWSRSLDSDRGGGSGHHNDDDENTDVLHDQDDRAGYGVGASFGTMQDDGDHGILHVATEKKPWLPSQ